MMFFLDHQHAPRYNKDKPNLESPPDPTDPKNAKKEVGKIKGKALDVLQEEKNKKLKLVKVGLGLYKPERDYHASFAPPIEEPAQEHGKLPRVFNLQESLITRKKRDLMISQGGSILRAVTANPELFSPMELGGGGVPYKSGQATSTSTWSPFGSMNQRLQMMGGIQPMDNMPPMVRLGERSYICAVRVVCPPIILSFLIVHEPSRR